MPSTAAAGAPAAHDAHNAHDHTSNAPAAHDAHNAHDHPVLTDAGTTRVPEKP
jgi:hypothetical protein